MSGFYTVVSITVSTGQVGPMHFDNTSDSHSTHKEGVLHFDDLWANHLKF
jgi:hypothetical protein